METTKLEEARGLKVMKEALRNYKSKSIATGIAKVNELKKVKDKAEELLEELEKGCGNIFYYSFGRFLCGVDGACTECEEVIKICKEILQ